MRTRDLDVDACIEHAAALARDVLRHLRALVHAACPGATETMRSGVPSFGYHGPLCAVSACDEYCTFGSWRDELRGHGDGGGASDALGAFGRIARIDDLRCAGTIRPARPSRG